MKAACALLAILALVIPVTARAQQTGAEVAADARAFGQAQGAAVSGLADSEATARINVPGYNGATADESRYYGDPAALDQNRASVASTNSGYNLTVEGNRVRPRINPADIDAATARANVIAEDPARFALGVDANGTTGTCVPLPPGSGGAGTFEASCNVGASMTQGPKSCPITLNHSFTSSHKYQCTQLHRVGRICLQGTVNKCFEEDFVDEITGDGCAPFLAEPSCSVHRESHVTLVAGNVRRAGLFYDTFSATCTAPVTPAVIGDTEWPLGIRPSTHPVVSLDLGTTNVYAGSTRNETACADLAADTSCSAPTEVCTDSTPTTRLVNGVSVTQPCWAWTRTAICTVETQTQDCQILASTPGCVFARDECLDDPQVGACKVTERVYTCPIPAPPGADKQFVCGGDVYCVSGDCVPIEREASTEFKDALVGLHTLSQAGKEFDSVDYKLFKGAGETCSKPVFGIANCCGGNAVPLIGTCSAAENALVTKIDKGFTHYVGTYCSKSFLGVCTSKRRSYCSFSSKLTRIVQEQGRPQISKTWGTPKVPNCEGFTVDEFARLDLSVMDFAEIYNDFIEAAKLPSEVQATADIQARIAEYYRVRGH